MLDIRLMGIALFFAIIFTSCANQQNILYRTVPYESEKIECNPGYYPVNNAYCEKF